MSEIAIWIELMYAEIDRDVLGRQGDPPPISPTPLGSEVCALTHPHTPPHPTTHPAPPQARGMQDGLGCGAGGAA